MAVVLRPGWELENPSNSSNIFKARVPQTLNGVPGGGTKNVEIVNNISTGNFDYYTVNVFGQRASQPFLSYNATNDIPTIRDLTTYGEFYDTQKGQTQYTTILKSSKEATLDLAQKNAGVDPVSVRNYNNIKAKPGYKSLGNAVTKPQSGPGKGTGNPQQTSAAGANATQPISDENLKTLSKVDASEASINVKKKIKEELRYPIDVGYNYDEDMLKIEIYDYVQSGIQFEDKKNLKLKSLTERLSLTEKLEGKGPLSRIYLPAYNQNGISDSLTVGWGSGELNPVTAQFAKVAMNTMNVAPGGIAAAGQTLIRGLEEAADTIVNAPELKQFLVNYFTEQAVNTTGLLSRTAGAAINNNVELLFTGVQLRDFTLTYRLTPRSKKEAEMIKDIIRAFKISMTPSLSSTGLFLLAPCVYKLSYVSRATKDDPGKPHPYLNKFKACALKGFNVNYTPDGNYMTYADGYSMTQYEIQFSFGEIDPIYRDDYADTEDTMGY